MKKILRCFVVGCFFMMTLCQSYGVEIEEQLFPSSTGLKSEVVGELVNVRSYPARDAQVVVQVSNEKVYVLGKNNQWYKVRYKDVEGWLYEDYLTSVYTSNIPYAKVKGEEIVAYSMQFLGTPYVWGGNDLNKGVDCSGFTQQIFLAFDMPISRVSYMQASDGEPVPKDALRTGDLVFFDTEGINNGKVSHVGIYVSEDYFIHSDSTKGVMISRLDSNYYTKSYVKAIRIV